MVAGGLGVTVGGLGFVAGGCVLGIVIFGGFGLVAGGLGEEAAKSSDVNNRE